MLSKLSWILFVPFTAAAVFLKAAQTLMADGALFGLSDMMLDYAVLGCVAVIFVFAVIMCLCDRKISQYYLPHRNIPAGIVGLLLALVLAADGANKIYRALSSGNVVPLEMVEAGLLLLSAVVFVVLGLTHSLQNRDSKALALFNVMPALLCAVRMVRGFVSFTTVSITTADITLLFCYIFATLFFFNYAVAISLTEAKHAVKSCYIFGLPAVASLLAYGVSAALNGFNIDDIFSNASYIEILLMAVYIFAFLIELTVFVKDRDHVIVEDAAAQDYQELKEEDVKVDDNFIVTGLDDDERVDGDNSYYSKADTEGYLYEANEVPETENEEGRSAMLSQSDPEGYITEVVEHKPKKPDPDKPQGYTDRLDEIDKLILEISEDYD